MNKIMNKLLFSAFILCLILAYHSSSEAAPKSSQEYADGIALLAKNMLASFDLFEEGKRLYDSGDYKAASLKFKEALEKDPGNEKAQKYITMCAEEIKNLPCGSFLVSGDEAGLYSDWIRGAPALHEQSDTCFRVSYCRSGCARLRRPSST